MCDARDFYNSVKIASDDWGLIVSIGVLASAVLDGVTVVACALDEVQVAAATITGSGLINAIAGLGGGECKPCRSTVCHTQSRTSTGVYILYLKDQGK